MSKPFFLWAGLLFAFCATPALAAPLRLAISSDGAGAVHLATQITANLAERGLSEGAQATFVVVANSQAEAKPTAVADAMQTAMQNSQIDAVIALGPHHARWARDPNNALTKPVFAALDGDAALIQVTYNDLGRSGKTNLATALGAARTARDLELFGQMVGFRQAQILVSQDLLDADAGLVQRLQTLGDDMQRTLHVVGVDGTTPPTLAPNIKAVYSALLPNLDPAARRELHRALQARGFAVFSGYGNNDVGQGAWAAALVAPQTRLVNRLVDHLEDWRNGSAPEDLPAYVPAREQPAISGSVAAALGLQRDARWFLTADVSDADALESGQALAFTQALELGLAGNYEIAVADEQKQQAAAGRRIGLSALLPQIQADANWQQNDTANAQVAAGFQAEEQTNLQVQVRQVLFDAATFNQKRSADLEAKLSEARYDGVVRDTINQVAGAYLNVLSQKALHEIDIENLKLTRSNLQTARSRLSLGAGGREEVYRWETQEAQNISAVYDSQASFQAARWELTRLLGKNNQSWYVAEKNPLQDGLFYQDAWTDLLAREVTPALRARLAEVATANSPDLAQQRLQQDLAKTNYKASLQSLFLPSLSMTATYQDVLDQQFASEGGLFPNQTEGAWSVSVGAGYPIFNGGRRFHQVAQNRARVRERDLQAAARTDQVVNTAYNALEQARADWLQIAPAERAAERAAATLQIVRSKYEQGTASLLDLLEAQEQALAGRRQSALAHYAYLGAVFQLQRALNDFPFLKDAQAGRQWVAQLAQEPEKTGPVNQFEGAQP